MDDPSSTYHTAQAIASDLAEDQIAAEIADGFGHNVRQSAAEIRTRSEAQGFWSGVSTPEDRYHFIQRAIYGAVYDLLGGYKGWKLVKEEGAEGASAAK